MNATLLQHATDNYRTSIELIEKATVDPYGQASIPDSIEEAILDALVTRDSIQKLLTRKVKWAKGETSHIKKLDRRLKEQRALIARVTCNDDLNKSFHPSPEAWWWSFELQSKRRAIDRLDPFWNGLSLFFTGLSLVFFFNITTQLLEGEPDVIGNIMVSIQTLVIPFVVGTLLTVEGRRQLDWFAYKVFKVHIRNKQEWRFFTAFTLFAFLAIVNVYLMPTVSRAYNKVGLIERSNSRFNYAKKHFRRAIKFNPDNLDAHSNLADIYEEHFDTEKAKEHYRKAVAGNVLVSLNNLGRLSILDGNYSEAAVLIRRAIETLELDVSVGQSTDNRLEYKLYKNLAWAKFEQKHYSKAEAELKKAIDIGLLADEDKFAAYCLMAKIYDEDPSIVDAQFREEAIKENAEKCIANNDGTDPVAEAWSTELEKNLPKP